MHRNPVGWFEIYVQDIERATTFYEAVLATEVTKLDSPSPDIIMNAFPMEMEAGGASGALVKMEGCPSGGMGTIVYFSCEDCATEEGRVESAGGEVCKPKTPIGEYGFITLVKDTEGNMFGLHSMR